MNKDDLKYGNVVELRNGNKYLYNNIINKHQLINFNGIGYLDLESYNDNLSYKEEISSEFDIMKIYRDYTCEYLLWERKEKPKLSYDEKIILRSIDKCFKCIARDKSGILRICAGERLSKMYDQWYSKCYYSQSFPYTNLFNFIKWEDEKPYLIEDLLNEE